MLHARELHFPRPMVLYLPKPCIRELLCRNRFCNTDREARLREVANRPVVLTDALKDWPALGKWDPGSFADRAKAALYLPTKGWFCGLQDFLG